MSKPLQTRLPAPRTRSFWRQIVVDFIDTRPAEIVGSFVVIEPSRVRISRLPPDGDD
jgi:hypothetical protein